jgi:RHS repeat-associated protein
MTRTKYDLTPNVVTTATTTTDGSGHYQFSTFSRCSVVEAFKASLNESVFQGGISISGCVKSSNDHLSFPIDMGSNLQDAGKTPCNSSIPRPVNVTNGNMYLLQTDYQLPGAGEAIAITRTYNSISTKIGLFGRGWTTAYDETVTTDANNRLQLTMPDGRLVTFATPDFFGQMVKNGDGSYTVTFKDGGVHQFNSSGKLLSQTDLQGNQTTLAYNPSGNLISVTDPFGRTLSITTNASGRVLSISDTMGTIASYTYGASNQLISVTYADNSSFQFSYDGSLRLTSVSDALGNVVESHTYDSQGRATTSETHGGVERYTLNYVSLSETDVTDALGHITKYFYGNIRARRVVTRVEGNCSCGNSQVQTWTYDNQLNITAKTDALNHTITFTYDGNGNRLTKTDAIGTVSYTYNQFSEVLTRTDQMSGVTTNTYDAQGNLITTQDALNNPTAFTHDSHGYPLTVMNARGKVTTFTWDSSGRLTQMKDALDQTANFTYDARARLTAVTNALSQTTSYEYDLAGRPKKTTFPDSNFVSYTYDLAGRRTKVTDPRGNDTNFAYDSAYRLTSVTDAASQTTSQAYDAMSNQTSTTDALARVTNYEYDDFNRLKKVIYPPSTAGATRLQETIEYDAGGNVKKKTDTAGRDTTYLYDDVNRLTKITDPALQPTQFEYNARSQTTGVLDALNQHYTFAHDPLGRTTGTTRASVSMSSVYDAVGNRTSRTDYNGATTNYAYDDLNRLTTITYPNSTSATYGYDAVSRLTSATNENGTVAFSYNNRGWVASTTDVFNQTMGYGYDSNGNRASLTLNGSTYTGYAYDAVNRLTQLTDSAGLIVGYGYDATNKLTSRTLPNGVASTYDYDGLSRLSRLRDTKGANAILDNQYSYNTANQIAQNVDLDGAHNYGYDAVDRLTSASYPSTGNENYGYDGVGNRLSPDSNLIYSYGSFNQLMYRGGVAHPQEPDYSAHSYGYDANGNLISDSQPNGNSVQYTWDFENRLAQAAMNSSLGSTTVTYKYDALGRRIQRATLPGEGGEELLGGGPTSFGVTTNFTYDGQDVVRDLNSDGSVAAEYLNGPGIDNKIRQTDSSNGALYFTQDHLGSTRALTNAAGNVVANWTYDSFGNADGPGPLAYTRYRYTGREIDADTGLYYYRARWYDSQVGRFITEDPIGFRGGDVNLYGYVWQNPLNFRDPRGLDGWGNDVADWMDKRIESGRQYFEPNPDATNWNTAINYAANTYQGAADMFRVGSGTGHAIYGPPDNGYGIAADILQDVSRASGIFVTLGGPAAGIASNLRGVSAARTVPEVCECNAGSGTPSSAVYRVWGDASGPNGSYWTTTNPNSVSGFRSMAGLPEANSGRFVSEGVLTDKCGVRFGSAAPGAGGPGGLPEVLVPDPARQIRLTRVSGANPPF